MAKEIKYGAEARAALEAGVNQLADTVKVLRRTPDHQRWCYDCKRDRAGRCIREHGCTAGKGSSYQDQRCSR